MRRAFYVGKLFGFNCMDLKPLQAAVFGNATLDVLCYTVDDVPRNDSITFERPAVTPGGCGSNVAIGLCALGIPTALVARIGADDAGGLAQRYWEKVGLEQSFIRRVPGISTGVSVGLIDSSRQPRFVHTPGANAGLTVDDLDLETLSRRGVKALMVAGFFVLPGLLDGRLPEKLFKAKQLGMLVVLDVVHSPRMNHPEILWPCLTHLDVFLCNEMEARLMTQLKTPEEYSHFFLEKGARAAVIKLGADGCWLESESIREHIPAKPVEVVDTTGAGDAFAAGLVSGLLNGVDLVEACRRANAAGARIVGSEGAVGGWNLIKD